MDRLSLGLNPSSHALRAWTMSAAAPAALTASAKAPRASCGSCSSTPIRHLTVTGTSTAAAIAATHSATSSGSRIRQAPKRPFLTRSDGQPRGVRAAELERDRMLVALEADEALARSEHDRVRRYHLGIEPRPAREH